MRTKAEQVRDWYAKALSDLKIAGTESRTPQPATDAVCFHYQQAVEKLLKCWLLWRGQPAPRTHNVEVLLAACEKLDPEFSSLRPAEALTPYAVELRYGDPAYFPTEAEMREAQSLAALVQTFIVERFLRESFDPRPSAA